MKYKIYKILFVFAIFFGNIAPTQAMTLEDYWAATDTEWNVWYDDDYYSIYNIDCSDSQYNKNPCCQFLDDNLKTSENAKKIYIEAIYDSTITSQEDAKEATPKECRYASNHCYSCKLSINSNNQITGNCLYTSYQDSSFVTCPNNFENYAHCYEDQPNQVSTIEDIDVTTFADVCYCDDENAFMMADNYCCPAGSYCENGTQIQCPAGYYCPDGTQKKCPAGTYSDPGATICSPCPTGYYCPDGTQTKCPEPWSLSAAGSDDINDCYVTLTAGKYINTDNKIQTGCQKNYICPGGNIHYQKYGTDACTYNDNQQDSKENVLQWVQNICPLAKDTKDTSAINNIKTIASWKSDNTTCYADIIIDTTCGQIVKEAVPTTGDKYLTWHNGTEIRPNSYYYNSLVAGLYATTLYSADYCTSVNPDTPQKRQLYKQAFICPGGKYCDGFPKGAPNCPNDGTNPDEFPPTGDVAAGYYSTGGAYQEQPTGPGTGCLTGNDCGQCPAGAQSNAGASSCSTCSDGTYSNASGATTCTNCEAGYYCTNGNRYTCPAGSTSYAGQSAKTDCYIMGGDGGTKFCVKSNCFNIQPNVEAYYSGNTSQ